MKPSLTKKAMAEFIGMIFFVYIGAGAAISTGEQLASSAAPTASSVARVLPISFAFGMSILVQVYSFGHISGGHFNPAVTYCLFLVGECEPLQVVAYFVAQFAGASLGSFLLWGSVSNMGDSRKESIEQAIGNPPFGLGANGLNPALSAGNGFLLEFMGTLVLCMTVVLTCLHSKGLAQGVPNMAPVAIGFAVFLSHLVLIPFTGCGINPARTFGPAIVNTIAGKDVYGDAHWIYYFGPFAAASVAAIIFKFVLRPDEADKLEDASPEQAPSREASTRNEDDTHLAADLMHRMSRNLSGRTGTDV